MQLINPSAGLPTRAVSTAQSPFNSQKHLDSGCCSSRPERVGKASPVTKTRTLPPLDWDLRLVTTSLTRSTTLVRSPLANQLRRKPCVPVHTRRTSGGW